MVELLNVVASWQSLILVVVVFGFAPGFCLRLIVLAYPRSDPRRAELIAELYAVPRHQRPLWVAEQLEVALFEGFGHRLSASKEKKRNLLVGGAAAGAAVALWAIALNSAENVEIPGDHSRFVSDVTIPDGTQVQVGEEFVIDGPADVAGLGTASRTVEQATRSAVPTRP